MTAKLKALPGIAEARAERHLPGTLMVRVVARTPKAWISCPDAGLFPMRRSGGMLVDQAGVAYPCPELQLEAAMNLPMILLPQSGTISDHRRAADRPSGIRSLLPPAGLRVARRIRSRCTGSTR